MSNTNGPSKWATDEMYNQLYNSPLREDFALSTPADADEIRDYARNIFDENGGTFGPGSIETEEEFDAVDWQELFEVATAAE